MLHTGREEPPDYPAFEVRDGRAMFLESADTTGTADFRRPGGSAREWGELPVSDSATGSEQR
ncbi:MAG: hypothetical protein CL731_03920 [Chloroflexi bacterium]|nr:hypothetical protein [Chloroflexota bacterium]